jgi:DNA-binding response OmpR family regulator
MRILVVEDDDDVRRALVRTLGRDGHEILAAGSLAACRPLFDAGIFDLGLPDGNGRDLAGELLAAKVVGRALFFTGTTDPAKLAAASALGVVVPKDVAELRRMLRRIERGEPGKGRSET